MRQHRVCLEGGPQLDINDLMRRGYLKPGAATDWASIDWRNEAGDRIAVAAIRADMRSPAYAWLEVQPLLTADLRQRFALVTRPRHFGGRQWLFQCPDTGRLVMKLYWPPDMHRFASRQSWGAHRVPIARSSCGVPAERILPRKRSWRVYALRAALIPVGLRLGC